MNKLSLSKILIVATIILIAVFQCYWITKLYRQERDVLRRETDVLFRDVVYKLQLKRLETDSNFAKHSPGNLFAFDVFKTAREANESGSAVLKHIVRGDSTPKRVNIIMRSQSPQDDNVVFGGRDSFNLPVPLPGPPAIFQYASSAGSISDSLPVDKIDSAYKAELKRNGINIDFTLKYVTGKPADAKMPVNDADELKTNFIFVGLSRSYAYQAFFDSPFNYLLSKIKLPILISVFLIAFTIISFVVLYRNLLQQRRLSLMKNEFISNITHELKTPIATVNVAIEALRNFNAIDDPLKTREYLDISASELQRLSLLVDKVLRLSMFENGDVQLKKENFDLKCLVEEVPSIMQLQIDKQNAVVTLKAEGAEFMIEADKLHITSVLYNLLDNALKYKRGEPRIEIILSSKRMHVELQVKDNGMGIPAEYKRRIFEKLFRVPTDDVHNAKGYGLGLSYVNHILHRHMGIIEVESELGKGTVFTARIPYKEMDVIWFDDKRSIRKKVIALPKRTKA